MKRKSAKNIFQQEVFVKKLSKLYIKYYLCLVLYSWQTPCPINFLNPPCTEKLNLYIFKGQRRQFSTFQSTYVQIIYKLHGQKTQRRLNLSCKRKYRLDNVKLLYLCLKYQHLLHELHLQMYICTLIHSHRNLIKGCEPMTIINYTFG